MSKSLMELVSIAAQIEQAIIENGGELTPEMEQSLDMSEKALSDKASSYAAVFDRLEQNAEFWRNKAKEYSKVAASLTKAGVNLKERMKVAILELGKEEIEGTETRIKLCKAAPKLVIDGPVPNNFTMVVTEIVPDKEKIKSALKDGLTVQGAHLEGGFSVRFYPKK